MPMSPPPPFRYPSASAGSDGDEPYVLVVETETEIVPLVDDDRPMIEDLVVLARAERDLQRAEFLHRYAMVSVDEQREPWFASPWARIGAAALLGYALGRSHAVRVIASLGFGAALAMAVDRALTHTAPAPARW